MSRQPLILIGGGGHCESVMDVLQQLDWPVYGILDNEVPIGTRILDASVIGIDADIPRLVRYPMLVTVGQIMKSSIRERLHSLVLEAGGELATVISPIAHVSKWAQIGAGTVVMNFANVSAHAHVGMGCIINTMSDIEHDSTVGDFCHISTGAIVNGNCIVGPRSFVGSHATLFQGISLREKSIIRAGAIIKQDQ